MRLSYSTELPDKEHFFELFQTTGWFPDQNLDANMLYEAISHSWYMFSVYDDRRLVGFGRVISDGVLHALIVEMIVLPDYQGKGIGKRIMHELVKKCEAHGIIDVQLFCAKGKAGFYEKYGFVSRPSDAPGMQLKR